MDEIKVGDRVNYRELVRTESWEPSGRDGTKRLVKFVAVIPGPIQPGTCAEVRDNQTILIALDDGGLAVARRGEWYLCNAQQVS